MERREKGKQEPIKGGKIAPKYTPSVEREETQCKNVSRILFEALLRGRGGEIVWYVRKGVEEDMECKAEDGRDMWMVDKLE